MMQGGGPTAVINASLVGILEEALFESQDFDRVLGHLHGFESVPGSNIIDLTDWLKRGDPRSCLDLLLKTPGAFLRSSRKRVSPDDLGKALELMRDAGSTSLIGIGGNGTMQTLSMLSEVSQKKGWTMATVGVPKTVDNDLVGTHFAPGFGSAARFVALTTRDLGLDFEAMSTFDDVTILEVMGRNTGWLAAAATVLKENECDPPHIVLLPEQAFDMGRFFDDIRSIHSRLGRVFIVVSEVLYDRFGNIIGDAVQSGPHDSLGRVMYSLSTGTGNFLAAEIWQKLGMQTRCLRPSIIGRALIDVVSPIDRKMAKMVGQQAVVALRDQKSDVMIGIDKSLQPVLLPFDACKQKERCLPNHFLTAKPPYIAKDFKEYAKPLIGTVDPVARLYNLTK